MLTLPNRRRPRRLLQIAYQPDVIHPLRRGIASGRRPHIIFAGASGTGKTTTALCLGLEQLCTAAGERPCLVCADCLAFERGSHPAFHLVDCQHHGRKDDIEFLLEQETGREPVGASHHYIVLEEADGLSRAAQSGLLVALQSTTSHRQFVFTCIDPETLIRPLRDRCRVFRLDLPDHGQALAFIRQVAVEEDIDIDGPALDLLAATCRGYRNLLEILEAAVDLAVGIRIDAGFLRRTVLRDRSAILLDYLSAVASGDIGLQLALLDECELGATEKVRAIRDILVHLRVHYTGRGVQA